MRIYDDPKTLAAEFAKEIAAFINNAADQNRKVNIALSGGSTPKQVFETLVMYQKENRVKWTFAEFFWGDERCVPADHPESNFGAANTLLFQQIIIPTQNLHPVCGQNIPEKEAERYASEIECYTYNGAKSLPVFDWIILGIGTDGHTASLFPNSDLHFISNNTCGVATHPQTGQQRISFTYDLINNAKRVSFLASGKDKAKVIHEIINKKPQSKNYPAAKIQPASCEAEWFIDKSAADLLD